MTEASWKNKLEASGIHALGIAPVSEPLTWPYYQETVEAGVPPQLSYLVKNAACRIHYEMLMPNTRSIVCCAIQLVDAPRRGGCEFARFCHIGDYHQVVRERLLGVESGLRELYPEIGETRICVDSAPVMERELAVHAGLGDIGFQRMLIHPELGSWIALGELFVDVDLMPHKGELEFNVDHSMPVAEAVIPGARCRCRAGRRNCVSACPVGALTDFGYDMHRCLSYWSTQHKGDIPELFAQAMGDVIWGCDRCQKACPRNAGITLAMGGETPLLDLSFEEILTLSARKIRARLTGTSIADAHPYMLQRNACIVIGNRRDSGYASLLKQVAETHSCDWIQRAALWALNRLN